MSVVIRMATNLRPSTSALRSPRGHKKGGISRRSRTKGKLPTVGFVGSVYVKDFGNTKATNFSLATNYAYKDKSGCPVIETTWFRIIAWDAPQIKKGDAVHVLGRLRERRYTGADGIEQRLFEVIASSVEPVSA